MKRINQVDPLTCKGGPANCLHHPLGLYKPCMRFVHPIYKSCPAIRRRTDSLTFLRLISPAYIVRIILLNNLYNLIVIKLKNNPKISTESVKRGDANPRISSFSRSKFKPLSTKTHRRISSNFERIESFKDFSVPRTAIELQKITLKCHKK